MPFLGILCHILKSFKRFKFSAYCDPECHVQMLNTKLVLQIIKWLLLIRNCSVILHENFKIYTYTEYYIRVFRYGIAYLLLNSIDCYWSTRSFNFSNIIHVTLRYHDILLCLFPAFLKMEMPVDAIANLSSLLRPNKDDSDSEDDEVKFGLFESHLLEKLRKCKNPNIFRSLTKRDLVINVRNLLIELSALSTANLCVFFFSSFYFCRNRTITQK